MFVIDGPTLVQEAETAGVRIVEQYVRDDYNGYVTSSPIYELDTHTFNSVADTEAPRGILAIGEIPNESPLSNSPSSWYLVADEVSDPGNLGTLIRSAEAGGVTGIVLSGSTVDPWSPKVVRASAGAVFHVPIWQMNSLQDIAHHGVRLLGTTSHNAINGRLPESIYECDFHGCIGIVVGNEAHGISEDAPVDSWITIPHQGRSESLNVAMAGTVAVIRASQARSSQ